MNYKKPKITTAFVSALLNIGRLIGYWNRYLVSRTRTRMLLATGLLFTLFLATSIRGLDPDFGWHLQSGNYILRHGIPAHDIFTYTARSFRWIDHEWGNDVIVSILYKVGGYDLVSVLYATIWTVALLIAGGFRARLSTLLAAALALMSYAGNRPVAWSVFFLSLVLGILRNRNPQWRWWIPLLFIAWANVHAGFIAGLAVMVYFSLIEYKRSTWYLLALSILATFVNAYGPRIYVEVFRTITDPALHRQIQEWEFLYIPPAAFLFVGMWLTGFWLYRPGRTDDSASSTGRSSWLKLAYWKVRSGLQRLIRLFNTLLRQHYLASSDRQWLLYWLGIGPLLFLSALSATRNLPLFVIGTVREVDMSITRTIGSIPRHLDRPRQLVMGSILGLFLGLLIVSGYFLYHPWQTNREAYYPVKAVAYLREHRCPGNLFNDYNYGGYLIWKLPTQPVYIDGRMPTWQPYMNQYESIMNHPAAQYATQFKRYDIRCALLGNTLGRKLLGVLRKAHWRTVLTANGSSLLLAP